MEYSDNIKRISLAGAIAGALPTHKFILQPIAGALPIHTFILQPVAGSRYTQVRYRHCIPIFLGTRCNHPTTVEYKL